MILLFLMIRNEIVAKCLSVLVVVNFLLFISASLISSPFVEIIMCIILVVLLMPMLM
jgi:hypothetical protein